MDKNTRINELLMDKDFQQKSLTVTTKEGVHDLFAEFGVELTAEEIDAFLVQLGAMLSEEKSSELSEDELDNVAGGIAFEIALTGAAASAFGIACGVTIGVGALALGGYILYKKLRKK